MRAETGELWGGAGQGDSSDGSDADEELPSLAEMTAPLAAMVGGVIQRTGAAASSAREKVAPVLRPVLQTVKGRVAELSRRAGLNPAGPDFAAFAAALPAGQPPEWAAESAGAATARAELHAASDDLRSLAELQRAKLARLAYSLPQQLGAPRAAALRRAVAVASAKVDAVAAELAGDSAAEFAAEVGPADDDGDAAAAALPGAGALRAASEGRQRQSQRHLLAFEHRLASLEATGGADGASPGRGGGEAAALAAQLAEAERSLREIDSAAAFELEQELWRCGLRGEKLKAKVAEEVSMLREQWQEHKLRLQAAAREERSDRAARRSSLTSYATHAAHAAADEAARFIEAAAEAALADLGAAAIGALLSAARRLQQQHWLATAPGTAAAADTEGDAPLRFLGEMSALYDSLSRQIRREVRIVCGMYRAALADVLSAASAAAMAAAAAATAAAAAAGGGGSGAAAGGEAESEAERAAARAARVAAFGGRLAPKALEVLQELGAAAESVVPLAQTVAVEQLLEVQLRPAAAAARRSRRG